MIRFLLLFCVFCAAVLAASWHELESEPAPPRPCVVCVENAAARAAPLSRATAWSGWRRPRS
ncbi:Uncharacterised protein [Chromobacterium violaceum]|uniref:Uncharacterized protein n=1 Tax=Chromobacterium violaceum TaxID=536 RepID=A0A3S4HNJ3_CHRVL|nr:Uncharacterised protein [Chromobacterium violaceum]